MDSLRGLAGAGFSGLADDAGIGREAAPPDAAVQNRNTRRSGQAVELGERAAERRPSLVEVEEAGCHGRRLNALRGPIPRSERARGRPERGDGLLVLVPSRSTVLAFATNEPQFGGRRPDMVFHYMKTTVLDSEFETMDFDVEGHLGAVKRSVASLERDGQPARAVVLSREYATTVEDLWDALTSGERIPRWFLPISGDLERWRPVPVGRQRGRRDQNVRTAGASRADVGVRRGRELGGGAFVGRWRRSRAADAHPHRAAFAPLGRVRAGGGRASAGRWACWDLRSISTTRRRRSSTKRSSPLPGTARRSSRAAARDGGERPWRRERTPPPRVPRRGVPPRSTPANRPRPHEAVPPSPRLPRRRTSGSDAASRPEESEAGPLRSEDERRGVSSSRGAPRDPTRTCMAPRSADDETHRQHDHRHPQPEPDDHQREPDENGCHVTENALARLEQPPAEIRFRHGARP